MKKETFFKLVLNLFSGSGHKIKEPRSTVSVSQNNWGISGRKTQMNMRALMQMKPFTSSAKFSK